MPDPKAIYLYATLRDVHDGVAALEKAHRFQYVRHALSASPEYTVFHSLLDLPALGECSSGSTIQANRYLILDPDLPIRIEPVPQRRGGVLYAVDQVRNPTAAFLALGGTCQPRCLIAWELMATSGSHSHDTFRLFRRYLFSGFRKVKYALVGPEAMRLYEQGWRLTQNAGANPLYDLQLS